jgi:hypothetical protein
MLRGGAKGDDLGMRSRIRRANRLVTSRADDLTVQNDDRSDRNFAALPCLVRPFERSPHELFITFDYHETLAEHCGQSQTRDFTMRRKADKTSGEATSGWVD